MRLFMDHRKGEGKKYKFGTLVQTILGTPLPSINSNLKLIVS